MVHLTAMELARSFHQKQLIRRLEGEADRCVNAVPGRSKCPMQPFPTTQPKGLGQSISAPCLPKSQKPCLPDIRRSPHLQPVQPAPRDQGIACDFEEVQAKLAICLDGQGGPRRKRLKRAGSAAQPILCNRFDDADDDEAHQQRKNLVGCKGSVMASIATKIDAHRSAAATPVFDSIRQCSFMGNKLPDTQWLARRMRPKEYYLGGSMADPWLQNENLSSEDFLARNSSSVEICKSRPHEKLIAIEERAIAQEAREDKAHKEKIRNRNFQKQLKQKKPLANACKKVGREVLGTGVLPVTPQILQQVQWLTVIASAAAMQKFHADLTRKKNLLRSTYVLQGFWRARRQFGLPQRRKVAARKFSVTLLCSIFAGRLLHRHRHRPSASAERRHRILTMRRNVAFLCACFAGKLLLRHRLRSPTHAEKRPGGTVVKCITEEWIISPRIQV